MEPARPHAAVQPLEARTLLSTLVFSEDFETPALTPEWTVSSNQAKQWRPATSLHFNGSAAGFAAGNPDGATDYPHGLHTRMERSVSLAEFGSATLSFQYWLNTEALYDTLVVSVNGTTVWEQSGAHPEWAAQSIDVRAFAGLSSVTIGFEFSADEINRPQDAISGAWLDEIRLTAGPKVDDDRFEPNDRPGQARSLGELPSSYTAAELVGGSSDWFSFTLLASGGPEHHAAITYGAQGELELRLFTADDATTPLRTAETAAGGKSVSLADLAAGDYLIEVVPAAGAFNPSYRLSIHPPAAPDADRWEPNDSADAAFDLGTVSTDTMIEPLAARGEDWYRLTTRAKGVPGDEISIAFDGNEGDLDLFLYAADRVDEPIRFSATGDGRESISMAGLPAGAYLIRVRPYGERYVAEYRLSIEPPGRVDDDAMEPNDHPQQAAALGTLLTERTLSSMVARSDDWYTFTSLAEGSSQDYVAIAFTAAEGDLDLYLYGDPDAPPLRRSDGNGDTEIISLQGLPAGAWFIRVHPFGEAGNSSYSLTVRAPEIALLQVNLERGVIGESAGENAVAGTIQLDRPAAGELRVELSTPSAAVRIPAAVIIPAGATSIPFLISVMDDDLLDGTQTAVISATAERCLAATATLDVLDDESRTLSLSLSNSEISERGGTRAATGTVSLSAAAGSDVIVHLASSDISEATVPASVVIPAGSRSAPFAISARQDADLDRVQRVTIAASAVGLSSARAVLRVTDDEPSAALRTTPAATAGAKSLRFGVIYADDAGINPATLGRGDVVVVGPAGIRLSATLASIPPKRPARIAAVTYQVAAPGGTWDGRDNGAYSLWLQPRQVRDIHGNVVAPKQLGTFTVALPWRRTRPSAAAIALPIAPAVEPMRARGLLADRFQSSRVIGPIEADIL